MAYAKSRLYIFGGEDSGGGTLTDLRYYDPSGASWSAEITTSDTNGPFAPARSGHAMFAYVDPADSHTKLYIYGGSSGGTNVAGTVYSLDLDEPGKPRWSKLAEGPALRNFASALVGDKIYVYGGYSSSEARVKDELWVYSITDDAWTLLGTMPSSLAAREGAAMAYVGGRIYLYGGSRPSTLISSVAPTVLNDLWAYDIPSNTWTQAGEGPGGRAFHRCVAYDGLLILYGGYKYSSGSMVYLSELWSYTPDTP